MKIENWAIVGLNPYAAPEVQSECIVGIIYGHPKHDDGKRVRTSRIVRASEGVITTKTGSIYELGEVNKEYEEEFPNARERIFAIGRGE